MFVVRCFLAILWSAISREKTRICALWWRWIVLSVQATPERAHRSARLLSLREDGRLHTAGPYMQNFAVLLMSVLLAGGIDSVDAYTLTEDDRGGGNIIVTRFTTIQQITNRISLAYHLKSLGKWSKSFNHISNLISNPISIRSQVFFLVTNLKSNLNLFYFRFKLDKFCSLIFHSNKNKVISMYSRSLITVSYCNAVSQSHLCDAKQQCFHSACRAIRCERVI